MKPLRLLIIAGLSLFFHLAQAQEAPPEQGQLAAFVSELGAVKNMGEACNEHMNYYAAKALEGAVCKEFKAAFQERWESPALLMAEWDKHHQRINTLPASCKDCQEMLKLADELRVKVLYFLDYMVFVKEM